jgi:hypothetical protein
MSIRNHSVWDGKIDRRKHASNVEKLTDVLLSYAKTDENKNLARSFVEQMIKENHSVSFIERELAYAIVDGLKWGNWPWWKQDLMSAKNAAAFIERVLDKDK